MNNTKNSNNNTNTNNNKTIRISVVILLISVLIGLGTVYMIPLTSATTRASLNSLKGRLFQQINHLLPSPLFRSQWTSTKQFRNMILNVVPMSMPMATQSPFLFAVHHLDYYPKAKENATDTDVSINAPLAGRSLGMDFGNKDWNMYHGSKVPGFPGHPHRGFETITVVEKGYCDHADSLNCRARFGNGDTQWVTTGKGIQHSEMFPQVNKDKDNTLELFQIWLNLPKKSKMVDPYFTMFWKEKAVLATYKDANDKETTVRLVAGSDMLPDPTNKSKFLVPNLPPPDSWAADPENHVAVWIITMQPGAKWELPKSEPFVTRSLYFFSGKKLKVGSDRVFNDPITLEVDPSVDIPLENTSSEPVRILMLQGRPIPEPVAQRGWVVMNTAQEVMQAFRDYQAGKFGRWPYERDDPAFPRSHPRYARFADGHEEYPDKAQG